MTQPKDTFQDYEKRFDRLIGPISTGQYGQFRGRLVRRLSTEEHSEEINRYGQLGERLEQSVLSGDTIDERLTTQIRATEVTLVLEKSHFLPEL